MLLTDALEKTIGIHVIPIVPIGDRCQDVVSIYKYQILNSIEQ